MRSVYFVALPLSLLLWIGMLFGAYKLADAERMMCDEALVPYGKTLSVSVDPDLSLAGLNLDDVRRGIDQWNAIWVAHHGFPIFAIHSGDWPDADVLVTAHGWSTTWVNTRCNSGYVQHGNNVAVVFVGSQSRDNALWVTHELGHTLGLADYIPAPDGRSYINPGSCDDGYIGIMSHCASPQTWLLDFDCLPNYRCDGNLVADYYK